MITSITVTYPSDRFFDNSRNISINGSTAYTRIFNIFTRNTWHTPRMIKNDLKTYSNGYNYKTVCTEKPLDTRR